MSTMTSLSGMCRFCSGFNQLLIANLFLKYQYHNILKNPNQVMKTSQKLGIDCNGCPVWVGIPVWNCIHPWTIFMLSPKFNSSCFCLKVQNNNSIRVLCCWDKLCHILPPLSPALAAIECLESITRFPQIRTHFNKQILQILLTKETTFKVLFLRLAKGLGYKHTIETTVPCLLKKTHLTIDSNCWQYRVFLPKLEIYSIFFHDVV